MAGYSGTPLPQKLGIKPQHRVAIIGSPAGFSDTLAPLPDGITITTKLQGKTVFDVIVFFVDRREHLARQFGALVSRISPAGGLWIAWPKKSSGVSTDLNENLIRDIGLKTGLVDNKVCAIDDTWSGLRFVRRLKDRPSP